MLAAALLESLSYVAIHVGGVDLELATGPDSTLRIFTPNPTDHGLCYSTKHNFTQQFRRREFSTTVHLNNMGWRAAQDYHGEPIDVAFVGDSFAFGHGVNEGERYTDVYRMMTGTRTYSYGYADGYTLPHYFLYLFQHEDLLPRRYLFINLFPWHNLDSDMTESHLILKNGALAKIACDRTVTAAGELINGTPGGHRVVLKERVLQLTRRSSFGTLLLNAYIRWRFGDPDGGRAKYLGRTDIGVPIDFGTVTANGRLVLEYVDKMRNLAAQHGARAVVIIVPPNYWVGDAYPCPYTRERCTEILQRAPGVVALEQYFAIRRIPYVYPIDALRAAEARERTYYRLDGHWTMLGNRVVGELLAKLYP